MPFVRFSRDKRGYEHLYLIDAGRERGRTRVLYWFRTPPGVKVGRTPFDADTQKALERHNPDVHFDWPQIVAAKMPPPAPVENWREKRRVERAIKRARAEDVVDSQREPEIDEPIGEAVELASVEEARADEVEVVDAVEQVAVADGGEPQAFNDTSPTAPAGPGTASGMRRRRRRRGRRRPKPEIGPVSASGNGGLDPPASDVDSSNKE